MMEETKKDFSQTKNKNNYFLISFITSLTVLFLGLIVYLLFRGREFTPYVLIMLGVAAIIFMLAVTWIIKASKNKEAREPNYYAFFTMGVVWLPVGIIIKNPGLWGMGLIFMILGLANKNKWKERKTWQDFSAEEKKLKVFAISALGLAVLVGLVTYLFMSK